MAIFEIAKNGIWSKKKIHEIDLFDFTRFFGLDFFKFSGPLWNSSSKLKNCKKRSNTENNYILQGQLDRLNSLWKESNNAGDNRLEDLKKNLESWELYEKQRNTLDGHIDGAQKEFEDTCRVYNLETGPKDYVTRLATAGEETLK